jgi:hypothetical protein
MQRRFLFFPDRIQPSNPFLRSTAQQSRCGHRQPEQIGRIGFSYC